MHDYKCWCIFCMKEFRSSLQSAEICPECMIEQEKAAENLRNDDDYEPL